MPRSFDAIARPSAFALTTRAHRPQTNFSLAGLSGCGTSRITNRLIMRSRSSEVASRRDAGDSTAVPVFTGAETGGDGAANQEFEHVPQRLEIVQRDIARGGRSWKRSPNSPNIWAFLMLSIPRSASRSASMSTDSGG